MIPAVPALSPAPAAWCPWPCCHLQGISHQLPLARGYGWLCGRVFLAVAPPRPKAGGKKPTGKFWRTFHSTIQELKKLNRFYILRLQPFSATLKTIYLRGCGCYAGKFSLPQMLRAATAEACNQRFVAFYRVAAAAKNTRFPPKVEVCQRRRNGQPVPACWLRMLCCSKIACPGQPWDCQQQVTALIVIYRARAKRGPGRAAVNPIPCHYPNMALPDPSLLSPSFSPLGNPWESWRN